MCDSQVGSVDRPVEEASAAGSQPVLCFTWRGGLEPCGHDHWFERMLRSQETILHKSIDSGQIGFYS